MARAKARILVTRIARPRQRSRRSWKLVDLTGAVAVLLVFWWVLDAPGADQRRSLADWVGGLGMLTAPSLETRTAPRTARLQPVSPKPQLGFGVGGARKIPASSAEADNLDASVKARGPIAAGVGGTRPAPSAQPNARDASLESSAHPAPSLALAYQIRDQAQFARAEVALRLALQAMPGPAGELAAEETVDGLRIRLPARLFSGSDAGAEAQRLIGAVAAAAAPLPNRLSICAGSPEPGAAPPDWDLSFARAAQARRLLEARGVAPARIDEISVRGGAGLAVTILRDAPGP